MSSISSMTVMQEMRAWRHALRKDQRWCILITADPDALASALALKRIMQQRVRSVDIARTNDVTRPDNLAMIRYLRIPAKPWQPERINSYTHFALVDSQPSHNPVYYDIHFDVIIDHHPLKPLPSGELTAPLPPKDPPKESRHADASAKEGVKEGSSTETPGPEDEAAAVPEEPPVPRPKFIDIRPTFGATSSMMTRYLQGLRISPSPHLATALLYGIRTDTAVFERSGGEDDLRAYQWLSRFADNNTLRRIIRSEYIREWLPLFSRAFRSLRDCRGGGVQVWLNEVSSGDLLVAVADFFTRIHGLKWVAVSGIVDKTVIVIFRGDGSRDIGRLADACFHDVGSAGGHRTLGRAEFPLSAVTHGVKPADFVLHRLQSRKLRPLPSKPQEEAAAPLATPANATTSSRDHDSR